VATTRTPERLPAELESRDRSEAAELRPHTTRGRGQEWQLDKVPARTARGVNRSRHEAGKRSKPDI
jgi:hypothetical protein